MITNKIESMMYRAHRKLGQELGVLIAKKTLIRGSLKAIYIDHHEASYCGSKTQKQADKKLKMLCENDPRIEILEQDLERIKTALTANNIKWQKLNLRLHRFYKAHDVAKRFLDTRSTYAEKARASHLTESIMDGSAQRQWLVA